MENPIPVPSDVPPSPPTFGEAAQFWLKLGLISFGGPTGQIAIMHSELVERRRWLSEGRFIHALNYCMLLPGPEAQQLATYAGWALHGTWGGVVAGALFVLPAAVLLWALSWLAMAGGTIPWVTAIFYGLQPAVLAIVAAAVLRIGSKSLKHPVLWGVALAAFGAIFFLGIPFIAIIFSAAVIGLAGGRIAPQIFLPPQETNLEFPARPATRFRTIRVIAMGLALWLGPIALLAFWRGPDDLFVREGIFFSKAALVTFGGAYAVLPYVAQQAVEHFGWLTTPQMMSGLALAETTPGPLILVLQYVGFVAAWQQPAEYSPLAAGTLGTIVTLWTTFLPSFLMVLAGAPHMDRLRHIKPLQSALTAITAAVVGIVLNLAVWFGQHALIPNEGRLDFFALTLSVVLFLGVWKGRWNLTAVIATGAVTGLVWSSLGGI